MNRRAWLTATTAALAAPRLVLADVHEAGEEDDPKLIAELRDLLGKVGIVPQNGYRTHHFLVIDDPQKSEQALIGRFCESLLANALDVFARTGIVLQPPPRKLTVVIVRTARAYVRLVAERNVDPNTGGFYSTRLRTIFVPAKEPWPTPGTPVHRGRFLANLGHESTHMIAYNTGLLIDGADVPACIGEGLAELGEVSSWEQPRLLRQTNPWRLERWAGPRTKPPVPLEDFFRSDKAIYANPDQNASSEAYAWAWVLVSLLMMEDDLRPRFGAYLKAIADRTDDAHRVEDARTHLGDLDALQARMVQRMRRVLANPPARYSSIRRGS